MLGFFNSDKKQGFGIYIWNENKVFVGLWNDGKQHGIGKYLTRDIDSNSVKFGKWISGKRISWLSNDDAFTIIKREYQTFEETFKMELNQIISFFYSDI